MIEKKINSQQNFKPVRLGLTSNGMKIGIDARFFGIKHRGLGRYVQSLIEGITSIDQENEYIVFLTDENFSLFKTDNPKVNKVLLNARWYSLKEQFLVPWVIKKYKLDLIHFPHFNVPWFFNGKFVVTIHDLIIDHFPDSRATTLPLFVYKFKLWWYKKIVSHAISQAYKIIVPSSYVKQDLMNLYQADSNKIKVIAEGYFIEEIKNMTPADFFKIYQPYLLYVGAAYPHKNLEMLISAFKKINQKDEYKLVLVGRNDFFYQRLINQTADKNVIFTGEVSDDELKELYRSALVCLVPSLYEGFGFPGLEAQACRLPVISSDKTALPETLGEGALYFNPESENDLIKKMHSLLTDENLRSDLIIKGLNNLERFKLVNMIKETLLVYRS
jgi:glycosyltransferase involved in cell wall biosynthesis